MTEDDIKNMFNRLVAIEDALWRIECRQQGKIPEIEQLRLQQNQYEQYRLGQLNRPIQSLDP